MSANLGTKCFKSFFEKIFLDKFQEKSEIGEVVKKWHLKI